jgi:predicted P-loop ATPase
MPQLKTYLRKEEIKMDKKKPYIIEIEQFLSKRWEFRYNEVLGRVEFCFKGQNAYRLMSEYDFNSILNVLEEEGYPFSASGLKKLLESRFVPKFNPFLNYLNGLEAWDGQTDYIDQLASTITTTNDDFWHLAFKKWFIAMVGSLLYDHVINHTFLVFTGIQGLGKTTWLNNLVPVELKDYYFAGTINPNNKDSQIQLAENMLINIDELQGLRSSDIEALKALVTTKELKIRRPYAVNHETLPHRASFSGSVNNQQFLSDVTGNRRFLCFEVKSIQYNYNIPLDRVFAQAVHLYKNGFQYWFNMEEIEFLNQNNEGFRFRSMEEELLLKYFEPCLEDDPDVKFMNATEIMGVLAQRADINFDGRNTFRLGKILNKHEFVRAKKKDRYGYYVKYKSIIGYGYADENSDNEYRNINNFINNKNHENNLKN